MSDTGIISIHGRDYQTVALRIAQFRLAHPDWAIITEILDRDDTAVLIRATIWDIDRIVATGHAEENRARGINKTAAVENCETSAVGRALAMLGYGGTEIASADEVRLKTQDTASLETLAALRDYLEEMAGDLTPEQLAFFEAHPVDTLTEAQAQKILARLKAAQ